MEAKLILICVAGLVLLSVGTANAIQCYNCTGIQNSQGTQNPNCLDPFKSDGIPTCTGLSCAKGWATGSGVTAVVRYCNNEAVASDVCVSTSVSGGQAVGCVCGSNLCNGGGLLQPIYTVLGGLAIAASTAITRMTFI